MAELPDVELLRRDLDKELAGKRIKAVEVLVPRAVRRQPECGLPFAERLTGRKVAGVARKGDRLLVRLDANEVLVVHLGPTGQVARTKNAKDAVPKQAQVILTLTQAGQLRFLDTRSSVELLVTAADRVEQDVPELADLGFDPFEDVMSWARFGELLHARRSRLKQLLMDSRFVTGIGNVYADEILWAAGLRHDRSSESLSAQEVRRLYRAMIETLQEAVKQRTASSSEEQSRDPFADSPAAPSGLKVHDREGRPCLRCRNRIVRIKGNGRSTFLCPQCQV